MHVHLVPSMFHRQILLRIMQSVNRCIIYRQILGKTHLSDIVPMFRQILFERDIFQVLLVDRERSDEEEGDNGGYYCQT